MKFIISAPSMTKFVIIVFDVLKEGSERFWDYNIVEAIKPGGGFGGSNLIMGVQIVNIIIKI